MKAAKLTEHPSFRLMRQTDVQNVWHMQMPRWLFSDPRYADMSLDAKVAYTFLPTFTAQRLGERCRRGICDLPPQGAGEGASHL